MELRIQYLHFACSVNIWLWIDNSVKQPGLDIDCINNLDSLWVEITIKHVGDVMPLSHRSCCVLLQKIKYNNLILITEADLLNLNEHF